jgi:GMP synthase PP-ATPase subunit
VFEEKAQRLGGAEFLAQGTLYPDVIESKAMRSKSMLQMAGSSVLHVNPGATSY